jgi:hypothetical protein
LPAGAIARAKEPYAITLLSALLFGALALVLLNTILADLPLDDWSVTFVSAESWGTDRGKIWPCSARLRAAASHTKALCASSGDYSTGFYQTDLFGRGAGHAHNEYLQYLVPTAHWGSPATLRQSSSPCEPVFRRSKRDPCIAG